MATTKNETATALEIDVITGETLTRELTALEIADRQEQAEKALARQEAETAKAAARQSALAKLAELGLTEEEIAAL